MLGPRELAADVTTAVRPGPEAHGRERLENGALPESGYSSPLSRRWIFSACFGST